MKLKMPLILAVLLTSQAHAIVITGQTEGSIADVNEDNALLVYDLASSGGGSADVVAAIEAFAAQNHTDLLQLDSTLQAFQSEAHSDEISLLAEVQSFHSDTNSRLTLIDTDLLSFKSANHTDLLAVGTKLDTGNASLSSIDGKLTTLNAKDFATSAKQDLQITQLTAINANTDGLEALATSGNASLASIDGKTPALVSGRVPVDGSGVTQPVSGTVTANQGGTWNINNISGTVSLPTGAATAANQVTANSSLSSIDGKTPTLGQKTMANSSPVVIASDQSAIPVTQSGAWTTGRTWSLLNTTDNVLMYANMASSYSPDTSSYVIGNSPLLVDYAGRLETHSTVTTDEGSFSTDFPGSAISTTLTGNVQFSGSQTTVNGAGTSFTTQVRSGQYIKKQADGETSYIQVDYVVSDTQLELVTPYGSSGGATTAVVSDFKTATGAGASIGVASSILTITNPTTNGVVSRVYRDGDYGPMKAVFNNVTLNNRTANQTVAFGFQEGATSPNAVAQFQFTGTVNTTASCVTSSSSAAADTQTTNFTLPNSATTAQSNTYEIDVSDDAVIFLVNNIRVCSHQLHIPGGYTLMSIEAYIQNTGTATGSTALAIDRLQFKNIDQVEIAGSFAGDPLKVGRIQQKYRNIVGNATTVVSTSPGTLKSICINNASTNGVVAVYDNTTNAAPILATINIANGTSATASCIQYDADMLTGITVVTSGSASNNVTVIYQ